jgi:hypothetical protein
MEEVRSILQCCSGQGLRGACIVFLNVAVEINYFWDQYGV